MSGFTLEQAQEAYYEELLTVPFHAHLGVAFDRDAPAGEPRVTIPPRPEILNEAGEHSPAAVYTLGEAASAIEMCAAIAPRAVDSGLGAIFFTVSGSFQARAAARGTIGAVTELVKGLEEDDEHEPASARKASVDVAARVLDEQGELVGEQRFSFYVRFMELSRMREMVRPTSAFARLIGP